MQYPIGDMIMKRMIPVLALLALLSGVAYAQEEGQPAEDMSWTTARQRATCDVAVERDDGLCVEL